MAFDSIKTISEAEENAKKMVDEATAKSREKIAGEKNACQARLSEEVAKAEKKAEAIIAEAEEKATLAAKEFCESNMNKCAIMTVRAENKFDEAANLIIGKVVGN